METSLLNSPQVADPLAATDDDPSKAKKRSSEADVADGSPVAVSSPNYKMSSKRFKTNTVKEVCVAVESKRFPHHLEAKSCVLSPITELSNSLSDTTLNDSKNQSQASNGKEVGQDTPLRAIGVGRRSAVLKSKLLFERNDVITDSAEKPLAEPLDTATEMPPPKDNEHLTDKSGNESFRMPGNPLPSKVGGSSRRLNLDASLDEMVVDEELSFYDEESSAQQQQAHQAFLGSPQVLGLLSPEQSPKRFHIVEKKSALNDNGSKQFLQPSMCQQRLQKSATRVRLSTASSNTPSKGFRMFNSLSPGSVESSIDDEYMELFEMESLEQQSSLLEFPSNLNSLISGKIKAASPSVHKVALPTHGSKLEMRRPSVRRCLSMTENQQQLQYPGKMQEFSKNLFNAPAHLTPISSRLAAEQCSIVSASCSPSAYCFKRPDPPSSATSSPVQVKRLRAEQEKENLDGSFLSLGIKAVASTGAIPHMGGIPIRKCVSMNDAEIMSALARSDSKDAPLIGDFTKPFALPLMEGRHRDLKSISSDTVARLLKGEFNQQVASFRIIDCRYPYEFEGGHIRGAKNLYTQEQIVDEFLTQNKTEPQQAQTEVAAHGRHIIIFHCEFSSERGPKLSRFLRNNDRARNTSSYPTLDYPEIYLLHNGYKEFYQTHAELCDPVAYRPMLEPSYSEEYRHFRAKSKSWNGDGLGGATSRLKKSRSRLML